MAFVELFRITRFRASGPAGVVKKNERRMNE